METKKPLNPPVLPLEYIYFPKTFEDLILPKRIKDELLEEINKTKFAIILHSSPGTGKTTTARLMTKNHDSKSLSGSNEFTAELMRKTVYPFVSGFSVLDKKRTLIIDECENIDNKKQDAFKKIIEQSDCNFIFITNEFEGIGDAIKSRCKDYDYDFVDSELEEQRNNYVNFAMRVCDEQNIKYTPRGLKELYKLNFPDFRHLLVNLDQFKTIKMELNEENVKKLTVFGKQNIDLYELILNPKIQGELLYSKMCEYKNNEKEALTSLGEPFFVYLNSKELYTKTLESCIIVAKYSQMYFETFNKFPTFMSCIMELKTLFR